MGRCPLNHCTVGVGNPLAVQLISSVLPTAELYGDGGWIETIGASEM